MNKLVWRGETVNGKYLGEVAILTELSPVVHCETFVDGHWRLWSYVGEKEQVIQQGKAPSLVDAQYVCEQTALAMQGLQASPPPMPVMQQPMPMPNMYQYPPITPQMVYEEVEPSLSLEELRYKFRRWAISLTMIGGVFLSIWYSMMLKPLSTISFLLVLASIVWGARSLIRSFKHTKVSMPRPVVNEDITIFPSPQILQSGQFSPPSFGLHQMQAAPIQAMPQLPIQTAQTNFYNPQLQMQNYSRSNG